MVVIRLIPAYAGRTYFDLVAEVAQGAHPRLRGADDVTTLTESPASGSSPLTRGGLTRRCVVCDKLRLIPAYAGRT